MRRIVRLLTGARHAAAFLRLPPRVAWFYTRACLLALVQRDWWSLRAVTKPRELRALIDVARGRRRVVEVGTGTAWTAVALALADDERTVVTLDPRVRSERERYLELAGAGARDGSSWSRPAPRPRRAQVTVQSTLYVWRAPAR